MNKAIIAITTGVLLMTGLFAQTKTQSGVVKTRGRMENGRLVPGKLLSGAMVQVDGRQAILAKDGKFSFPVTGGYYMLNSVAKQGYQLVDVETCRRYSYSANPLTVVMETPEQQMQDKLTAERKIRRQLQDQLREREDEIEALREQKSITDEQCRNALQELYTKHESNEKLIADMAKRYSELDYDQFDEFQRQVSCCIENGQLAKADSLLRSRGDVAKQVEATLRAGAAIQQQREWLQKAETVHSAEIEEVARRCYSYYELFVAKFQNDSAARYLELRSSLDTDNVEWLGEAAYFVELYLADYSKALSYYRQMLKKAEKRYGVLHPSVATAYTGIGRQYMQMGKTDSVWHCFDEALKIRKKCFGEEHSMVANSLVNMGVYNLHNKSYKEALDNYLRAQDIYRMAWGENNARVADSYNSIGICRMELGDSKAMDDYSKALAIDTVLYGNNHPDVAVVYMNMATMYAKVLGDNSKASEYYQKSLDIEKQIFGDKHPRVARVLENMASNAIIVGDYERSLDYSLKSVAINTRVYGEDNTELVSSYDNIGLVYMYSEQCNKALPYLEKSAEIIRKAFGNDAQQLYSVYFALGGAYNCLGDNAKALESFKKSLSIQERWLDEYDQSIGLTHYNIAEVYRVTGNTDKALEHYSLALKTPYIDKETEADIHKAMEEINNEIDKKQKNKK